MNRKYELATLGCKVNQYESQQLSELLRSHGWSPASPSEVPDLALVNTCAVTSTASRKSRQLARRAGRNGRTRVVLVGCNASAEADRLANLPGVAAVWGHECDVPANLARLLSTWNLGVGGLPDALTLDPSSNAPRARGGRTSRIDHSASPVLASATPPQHPNPPGKHWRLPIIDATPGRSAVKGSGRFPPPIRGFEGHARAFVKVQDGCDAHCTYCIIPRLRGEPTWKPVAEVVSEVAGLVERGFREIVLTGVFLGAYGRRTAVRRRWPRGRQPLAELVEAIARLPGLARLRLSSLEPGDVTDDLLAAMTANPVCVPHLHLPLQSGSDRILRRMNRQYTRNEFVALVARIREAFERLAISTDILVGFPGETDGDFADTLAVARDSGVSKIHAFPFSPREGTAAAGWSHLFVPTAVVRRRMGALARLERELSLRFRRQFVGEVHEVLVEGRTVPSGSRQTAPGISPTSSAGHAETTPGGPGSLSVGRTDRYFKVWFGPSDASLVGKLVPVRITAVTPTQTHGVRV